MIRFECDYAEGAHPLVLQRLLDTNLEQTPGYGMDAHCQNARALIRVWCAAPHAQVHFLVGGTQTNATVIAHVLRPHQGVLSAASGHINGHETGAVEATGHKVLALASADGKITAQQVLEAYRAHMQSETAEHEVQPGMVYISHPTENGTLYTKAELTALSEVCRSCHLPLFMDGARLGYALGAQSNNVTPADIAALCDVFYIGGTKVGALFGEAVVFTDTALEKDFRYAIKQHGGMLAKGRLLGVQFETLLQNGLYESLGKSAVAKAMRIQAAFAAKETAFLFASPTNQQFPILPQAAIETLRKKYAFSAWKSIDDTHTAVRFCTSWATTDAAVEALCADIAALQV